MTVEEKNGSKMAEIFPDDSHTRYVLKKCMHLNQEKGFVYTLQAAPWHYM
jgi:hypothetical protein